MCELGRRGRLLLGEPYFEHGVPIVLDTRGAGDATAGDLVVVTPGRRGNRARVALVLGPARRIAPVLDGLLYHLGVRRRLVVALRLQRSFIGVELNPDYAEMARRRIADDAPLFNTGAEVPA